MRFFASLVLVSTLGPASVSGSSGNDSSAWSRGKGPSGACLYVVGNFPRLRKDFFRILERRFGVPENSFDSSRSCAYVLFKQAKGVSSMLLAPVRARAAFAPQLTVKKGYLLLSRDPKTVDRISAALSFTAPSVISPPEGTVHVYGNAQAFSLLSEAEISARAEKVISRFWSPGVLLPRRVSLTLLELGTNFLRNVEEFSLRIDASGAELSVTGKARMRREFFPPERTPAEEKDLIALPGPHTVTVTGSIHGLRRYIFRLGDHLISRSVWRVSDVSTLRTELSRFASMFGNRFAVAYDFTPEGVKGRAAFSFRGGTTDLKTLLLRIPDQRFPSALRECMPEDLATLYSIRKPFAERKGSLMFDRLPPTHRPDAVERQRALRGTRELSGAYTVLDGVLLFALGPGEEVDRLAELAATVGKKEARSTGPAKIEFDFDVGRFARWVEAAAELENPIPIPTEDSRISGAATFEKNTVALNFKIPVTLLRFVPVR